MSRRSNISDQNERGNQREASKFATNKQNEENTIDEKEFKSEMKNTFNAGLFSWTFLEPFKNLITLRKILLISVILLIPFILFSFPFRKENTIKDKFQDVKNYANVKKEEFKDSFKNKKTGFDAEEKWEDAKDYLKEKKDDLQEKFEDAGNRANDYINKKTGIDVKEKWEDAKDYLKEKKDDLKDAGNRANDYINKKTGIDVEEKWEDAKDYLKDKKDDLKEKLEDVGSNIKDFFTEKKEDAKDYLKDKKEEFKKNVNKKKNAKFIPIF